MPWSSPPRVLPQLLFSLTPEPCSHVPSTEQVCPVEGRQIRACLEARGRPLLGKGSA